MTITDQELADEIRTEFGKFIYPDMKTDRHANLGRIIAEFCDRHPAWQPTAGGMAVDGYGRDVHIIGPHPKYPDMWVVADAEDGELVTEHHSELTPKAAG